MNIGKVSLAFVKWMIRMLVMEIMMMEVVVMTVVLVMGSIVWSVKIKTWRCSGPSPNPSSTTYSSCELKQII